MLRTDYNGVVDLIVSSILQDFGRQSNQRWKTLVFLNIIFFVLPIAVVTWCYFWILKVVRKQSRRIEENQPISAENDTPPHAIQNQKAIKTIGFVLGVFIVSWMPSLVVSVVDYVTASDKCVDHKLIYVVWPWIEAIGLTSSAVNPCIYFFRNREFHEALRRCFHWFPLNATDEFALERDRNQRMWRKRGI